MSARQRRFPGIVDRLRWFGSRLLPPFQLSIESKAPSLINDSFYNVSDKQGRGRDKFAAGD